MKGKLIAFCFIVALVIAFFASPLGDQLTLADLERQQAKIDAYHAEHPGRTALLYVVVYVAVTTLSLPGAGIMTLAGGAVFGLLWGTVLVSIAATLGASFAFLVSRFLFRGYVQRRFGGSLRKINQGVERDGTYYLFFMRLVPVFPYFVINLVMGLTPMPLLRFALVSWIGMVPGTFLFVNAGAQLRSFELSFALVVSLVLIGIFPFVAKRAVAAAKARRVLRPYPRPARFDRNLVVIGAGSAGLVTAYIAAAVKAKVTLVEQHKMGGDCLNTGCVPSKALIRSAKFLSHCRRSAELGFRRACVEWDFADVMERVKRVVRTIEPHDSMERYTALGVECIAGTAKITSPFTVEVNGRTIFTRSIVIAAGARPFVPPIPGIEEVGYVTSDTLWDMRVLPPRLLVLGGGPIGAELAQCFARFGSRVTVVEMLPRLLMREDPEVSALVLARFEAEGVDVRLNHRAVAFRTQGGAKSVVCEHEGEELCIEFDELLVAVGRAANLRGYGLEELGVPTGNTVEVNEYLQTRFPNIYACGDVAGPYQFTHVGAHQAWYAAVNALFGSLRKFRADYSVIPWATFTEPEVARVGLNETEAKEQGVDYEVSIYRLEELDRAVAEEEAHGLVKVLTVPGQDRILGATIVGEHAGDLIAEYVTAMRYRLGMNKILGTIHVYPTFVEANRYAAGIWKRAHAPEGLLRWVERYLAWQRG